MGSTEYPTAEWLLLGEFEAEEKNGPQVFRLQSPDWARFLKFRFINHYGKEDVWTITSICVYGKTVMETLKDDLVQSNLEVKEALQNIQNVPKQPTTIKTDEIIKDESSGTNEIENNNVNDEIVVDIKNEEKEKEEVKEEIENNEIKPNNNNTIEESNKKKNENKTSDLTSVKPQHQKQAIEKPTTTTTTISINKTATINNNSITNNKEKNEVNIINENEKENNTTIKKSNDKSKNMTTSHNNNNTVVNETESNNILPTSSIDTNPNPTTPANPTVTATATATATAIPTSIPTTRSVAPDSANSIFKILTDKSIIIIIII